MFLIGKYDTDVAKAGHFATSVFSPYTTLSPIGHKMYLWGLTFEIPGFFDKIIAC